MSSRSSLLTAILLLPLTALAAPIEQASCSGYTLFPILWALLVIAVQRRPIEPSSGTDFEPILISAMMCEVTIELERLDETLYGLEMLVPRLPPVMEAAPPVTEEDRQHTQAVLVAFAAGMAAGARCAGMSASAGGMGTGPEQRSGGEEDAAEEMRKDGKETEGKEEDGKEEREDGRLLPRYEEV
ncbi:hypothetical protein JCM8547_007607 [Rhodosporidiobolus lusitaniae]